jgi:cytochrome c-type biogenesis protein CcmH/NrfG
LGSQYLSQQDFGAAEQAFAEAIKLNSADANACFNLGNVFLLTARYQDAARVLGEGLLRDPRSAFGHYLLGSVETRTGQVSKAERSLQKALVLDPEMPNVRLELANLYLVQNEKSAAIRELRLFVEQFPSSPLLPKVQEVLKRLQTTPELPE